MQERENTSRERRLAFVFRGIADTTVRGVRDDKKQRKLECCRCVFNNRVALFSSSSSSSSSSATNDNADEGKDREEEEDKEERKEEEMEKTTPSTTNRTEENDVLVKISLSL